MTHDSIPMMAEPVFVSTQSSPLMKRLLCERAALIRVCFAYCKTKEVAEKEQELKLLSAAPSLTSYSIISADESSFHLSPLENPQKHTKERAHRSIPSFPLSNTHPPPRPCPLSSPTGSSNAKTRPLTRPRRRNPSPPHHPAQTPPHRPTHAPAPAPHEPAYRTRTPCPAAPAPSKACSTRGRRSCRSWRTASRA